MPRSRSLIGTYERVLATLTRTVEESPTRTRMASEIDVIGKGGVMYAHLDPFASWVVVLAILALAYMATHHDWTR